MDELKQGDIVKLKSGSVNMVIANVNAMGEANCFYYDYTDREIKSSEIPLGALRKAEETER